MKKLKVYQKEMIKDCIFYFLAWLFLSFLVFGYLSWVGAI